MDMLMSEATILRIMFETKATMMMPESIVMSEESQISETSKMSEISQMSEIDDDEVREMIIGSEPGIGDGKKGT